MSRAGQRLLIGLAALSLVAATVSAAEPFVVPTLPASPTAVCAPAPRSRLILHERARVSIDDPRPLNMRDAPGTSSHVIAQIPASGVLYVLEGPKCSQSYAWYRVEFNGITGWIAEGDDTAYFVELYPPG